MSEPAPAPVRPRNPWWIPPFLGRVPALAPAQLRLLGLVALALFFEHYDLSMLTAALKYIARDLGVAEAELGGMLSVIRLGALGGFVLVAMADRIGRRRLFLVAMAGSGIGTFATALAQTAPQFVAVQMVTRAFLVSGLAVAVVIVTEEFPARHRGWGVGMLGALGASGVGFGALLFAAVEWLPGRWRALYVLGLVPLLFLPLFSRGVPETARFRRRQDEERARGDGPSGPFAWLHPFAAFLRTHPARALGIGVVGSVAAMGRITVFAFTGYYLLQGRGWEPWQYSLMVFVGGAVGIVGNVVAGRLGDAWGRRGAGFVLLALSPVFAWMLYRGSGAWIPLGWSGYVFFGTGQIVLLRAVSAELFPTSHRSTASGWLEVVDTLGAAVGLALVGLASRSPGDLAVAVSWISLTPIAAALLLLVFPETGRRELESLSQEDA